MRPVGRMGGGMVDFGNLLGPPLLKTCPSCGGSGRPIRLPWVSCEPCDGSGMVPNATGRALLDAMREERTSLVVMGVCGRSNPAGAAGTLGGTILKVIEDGRIPILTAA